MSENQNALAISQRASPLIALGERFAIEPNKLVEVLRGTVIKPTKDGRAASNEEVAAFCMVANQYGLNPFTREIHAFADPQKGVVPIVGIDGWTHIVNAQPGFDGVEFSEDADEKGKPKSVTCVIYVKGREHPVRITERYAECYRPTGPWNTMPFRMLRHKAFMQAARYAFSLSGIYDEDEGRDIVNKPAVQISASVVEPEKSVTPAGTSKLAKKLAKDKSTEPVFDAEVAAEGVEDVACGSQGASEGGGGGSDQSGVVAELLAYADGFPKMFAKGCAHVKIAANDWQTAPEEALVRLLSWLNTESSRQ